MKILADTVYKEESNFINTTKRVVKFAVKTTAYTAFLGIAVASTLHLYNHPEDRESITNSIKTATHDTKKSINQVYHNITGYDSIGEHIDNTTEYAKRLGQYTVSKVKQETPKVEKTIKEDAEGSAEKAKEDVKQKIKQVRQYSGDLTQRLANEIKPK